MEETKSVAQQECTKCHQTFGMDEYYKKKGEYTKICKGCRSRYARGYYEENKEKILNQAKERYAKKKGANG
jgi:predicted CXXCH cytochrome family protein